MWGSRAVGRGGFWASAFGALGLEVPGFRSSGASDLSLLDLEVYDFVFGFFIVRFAE